MEAPAKNAEFEICQGNMVREITRAKKATSEEDVGPRSRNSPLMTACRTTGELLSVCYGKAVALHLPVRVFGEKTKRVAYTKQTQVVKGKNKNKSNCPLCAVGDDANKARIYDYDQMDADHVAAGQRQSLARAHCSIGRRRRRTTR